MNSDSFYDEFDDEEYTREQTDEWLMQVFMGIGEVRLLYNHVCYAIETWPGSPARPAEEQEYLMHLKQKLFAMICDYQFTEGQ
tara:strand:- start:463 stop:711 length:249 start_codon:yes stop_codon:yes gene_type:complete